MSGSGRATFDAEELAVVLSHYDLGVIESLTEFQRGSRRSPKLGIVAERGKFLLKRRAASKARTDRVRFSHRVQIHLDGAGFPVARLVSTRDGSTAVQFREQVHELFEYVPGHPYQETEAEATDAGAVLGRFHAALSDFVVPPRVTPPTGDYHDAPGVRTSLVGIESTLSAHDSFTGEQSDLVRLLEELLNLYNEAAEAANSVGLRDHSAQIIHGDWHPGNLLFRKSRVVAVIDYDSVRHSQRIIDVANGVLQFSILSGHDPVDWPAEVDEPRYHAFLRGYESLLPITDEERRVIPALMAEALLAECVAPIQQTGSVGRWTGYRVLQMVRRKMRWLDENGPRLAAFSQVDRTRES